ncbi:hypothetical protein VCHENC02_1062A, partial [Vibrio harveyi]|jgi:hypothetical protein
MPLL